MDASQIAAFEKIKNELNEAAAAWDIDRDYAFQRLEAARLLNRELIDSTNATFEAMAAHYGQSAGPVEVDYAF